MKIFTCPSCGQILHFENVRCVRCDHTLGYLPDRGTIAALEPLASGGWIALGGGSNHYRFCRNREHGVCNWMLTDGTGETFCVACSHNRAIPDLSVAENVDRWRRIEEAKHRLFYSLLKLSLPLDGPHRLTFDFLAPSGSHRVMTGHDDGVITLAATEADDAERERARIAMGERYRTLLGHFRHEIGHYYWDVLVAGKDKLDTFRALFGDEREDYEGALQRHYRCGPPPDWRRNFVSAYASSHPWEDFAETWAHYLHIVDTLETGSAFGLKVASAAGIATSLQEFDSYRETDIDELVTAWLPLAFAVNDLNRSMGQPDLYPFVLTPAVIRKLGFVLALVQEQRQAKPVRPDAA
jgi:hypothetical protein